MRKTPAFWDASALVPLCVEEAQSARARSHARRFEPVVWWVTLVEVRGAISRLHGNGELSDRERDGAIARLQLVRQSWREILPNDELRVIALGALDNYALRAADSLQLAAALVWCGQRPSRRVFICGDRRLASAAALAGFTVLEVR